MSLLARISNAGTAAFAAARDALRAPGSRAQGVAVPAPWTDRSTAVLGSAVDPVYVTRVIARRSEGYLAEWADLLDHARRTLPAIQWELGVRELSLQETPFEVLPGEGSNGRGARRAADACRELLAAWQSRDTSGGEGSALDTWLAEWVAAIYYPLAAHEVTWERDGALVVPVTLEHLSERRLSYACDRYDPRPWAPRLWDQDDSTSPFHGLYGRRIDSFHRDKFLVHKRRTVGGHPAAEGLGSVLVWFWLFGVLSWRDLVALIEMLGRPPVVAYYAASKDGRLKSQVVATDAHVQAAYNTVHSLTGALRAVLPDTVSVEAIKHDLPTTTPIQLLTSERIDKYVARVINGTDGVTSIVPGSRAAQQTAFEQTLTPYRADCRYAERMLSILFARFVRANPDAFGASCPLPTARAAIEESPDLEKLARALQTAKNTGARLPESWYHDRLGIPVPKPNEPVLGATAAQGQGDGTGTNDPTPTLAAGRPRTSRELAALPAPSGVMVCLAPPPGVAAALAIEGGESPERLHVTLALLGDTATLDEIDRQNARRVLMQFALAHQALTGSFGGVARFSGGEGVDALVATVDVPGLEGFREDLVAALALVPLSAATNHGFVPHCTLAYLPAGAPATVERLDPVPVTFGEVCLWWGPHHETFPLVPSRPTDPTP